MPTPVRSGELREAVWHPMDLRCDRVDGESMEQIRSAATFPLQSDSMRQARSTRLSRQEVVRRRQGNRTLVHSRLRENAVATLKVGQIVLYAA